MLKYIFYFTMTLAAAASEVDFSQPILDLTGPALDCDQVALDGKCIKVVPLTLGRFAAQALASPQKNENISISLRRGILSHRIFAGNKIDLSAEDIVLIKDSLPLIGARTSVLSDAIGKLDPVK